MMPARQSCLCPHPTYLPAAKRCVASEGSLRLTGDDVGVVPRLSRQRPRWLLSFVPNLAAGRTRSQRDGGRSKGRLPLSEFGGGRERNAINYDCRASRKQYIWTYGTPATILGRVVDTQK